MEEHDISTTHIHALLVSHHIEQPKSQQDVYADVMGVIRAALAFGLNHREDLTEWNYETLLGLRLNLFHAGGMGSPKRGDDGVYR